MPGSGRTIYIAGAGIAGLTLALTLAKFGAKAMVLERSPVLSEFGAGLQISPNAYKVLDRLGLGAALTTRGLEPAGIDIYPFGRPNPLVTLELGETVRQRFGAPYVVMHRADLADALYKACRRFANIDIAFGVRDWDVTSSAKGVSVTIQEADGHSRNGRGFGFIGADGVHSPTRTGRLDGPAAQYQSRVAWRTLLPFDTVSSQLALDKVSVLFGPGYHLVCYPLPHRRQFNLALFARQDEAVSKQTLQPHLKRRSPRIEVIMAAAGDSWTPWPLYTVQAPRWHDDNIGLIGDAAHAMVPFQAQGAAMAIEDAAALAPLLVGEPNAAAAFAKFHAQRRPRVDKVARISAGNGRIFHLRWPLSVGRNTVIAAQGSRAHLKRLAWIYGYDAQAVTSQ